MKFLFKSRDTAEAPIENKVNAVATAFYQRAQSSWADWMQRKTAGSSHRNLTVTLILFILLSGGYSLYLMAQGLTKGVNSIIAVQPISMPSHTKETGDPIKSLKPAANKEYERIHQFHLYMDSLARSPTGKSTYDSITTARPGLMDSVRISEKYYQQSN